MKRAIYRFLTGAIVMCGLVSVAALPVAAATQGTVGSTSTGTTDISVTVPWIARISALNDINLGTWTGTGAVWAWDTLCVWTTTGAYNITATGDGVGSAYTVTDGTDTIAYLVAWSDTPTLAGLNLMTSGTGLPSQNTTATSSDCNGGSSLTATVLVAILAADLAAAQAGTYSGTLTLLVAPE